MGADVGAQYITTIGTADGAGSPGATLLWPVACLTRAEAAGRHSAGSAFPTDSGACGCLPDKALFVTARLHGPEPSASPCRRILPPPSWSRYHVPMIPLSDDNPTSSPPIFTVAFIVACVAVFFWQASLDADAAARAVFAFGMVPAVLFGTASLPADVAVLPPVATVITSMFLHGGVMHLLGNMLYLWIFGNNVEDAMGSLRFVVFYLLCGVVAAMTQALAAPGAEIPMIGASGAISGVLGAYILLYPHARIRIVIPIGFYLHLTYMPAMIALGLWMGLQIMSSLMAPPDQGGTAWFAHIGGFVAGMLLIPFFKRRGVRLFQAPRRR